MATILPLLRAAAVARGLLPDDAALTREAAFALVRDMPYERASSREPRVVIEEWRGTCLSKHLVLREVFREIGTRVTLLAATHEFTPEAAPWLPPYLRAMLDEGPLPDVHNFLRIKPGVGPDWMTVDATWPIAGKAVGLPVNETWVDGRDMRVACDPDEVFHVPDDEDPVAYKARLVEDYVGDQAARRDRFIEALSEWLAALPSGAAARGTSSG